MGCIFKSWSPITRPRDSYPLCYGILRLSAICIQEVVRSHPETAVSRLSFPRIHYNIIQHSCLGFLNRLSLSRINLYFLSFFLLVLHDLLFSHPNFVRLGTKIMTLLFIEWSPSSCWFIFLRTLSHSHNLHYSLNVKEKVSCLHKRWISQFGIFKYLAV